MGGSRPNTHSRSLDGALELWFDICSSFRYQYLKGYLPSFKLLTIVSGVLWDCFKIKRDGTLQIWDHAIKLAETNLYLSSDLCAMAPSRNCIARTYAKLPANDSSPCREPSFPAQTSLIQDGRQRLAQVKE